MRLTFDLAKLEPDFLAGMVQTCANVAPDAPTAPIYGALSGAFSAELARRRAGGAEPAAIATVLPLESTDEQALADLLTALTPLPEQLGERGLHFAASFAYLLVSEVVDGIAERTGAAPAGPVH